MNLQAIYLAQHTIAPLARRTPLIRSVGLGVYLKLETLQPTGAFKVRGAANKILSLSEQARAAGVITVSTGNHGRAVAYVAHQLGIPATICISELVPHNKVEALQALNAEVVIHGKSQDEAGIRATEIQQERDLHLIHPFDDPHIIAGQGTIGLELLQDLPQIDTVLVPLSGGGLISGIAFALKTANPNIRVIGISMERGPAMYHSLQAGKPVEVEEQPSLADSLGGGIGLDNRFTFALVKKYVDEVVLLTEEEIADGMLYTMREEHLIVEGAGAIGVAAILHHKIQNLGEQVALIISGGNADVGRLMDMGVKHGS